PGKGFTEDEVCLYIENELDYRPANDIHIKLGAVVEEPPKLPSRKVRFVIVLIVVAVAFWVASQSYGAKLPSNDRLERTVIGSSWRAAGALRYIALASRWTRLRP